MRFTYSDLAALPGSIGWAVPGPSSVKFGPAASPTVLQTLTPQFWKDEEGAKKLAGVRDRLGGSFG